MVRQCCESKAKYKKYSYARFNIRAKKNSCLHDDVEDFVAKRCSGTDSLVAKLLDNQFAHKRYTDPSYPM